MAKYLIKSYDPVKDVAVVDVTYKFKTVQQPVYTVRAHGVPVDDKEGMDAFVLGVVAGRKKELQKALAPKALASNIVTEQTVSDPE